MIAAVLVLGLGCGEDELPAWANPPDPDAGVQDDEDAGEDADPGQPH
jgi:hypothetical protein